MSLKFFVGLALSFLGVTYFTYAKLTNLKEQVERLEKE
jgi:hypothetical protein